MYFSKQFLYCFSITFLTFQVGLSQQIPTDRITDWENPGCGNHFVAEQTVNMNGFGLDASGNIPCDSVLQSVLASLNMPSRLMFSEGTYLFNQTIVLPDSIILEGGADDVTLRSTVLFRFAPGIYDQGILIQGSETDVGITLSLPLNQGKKKVYVPSANTLFSVGDIIRLYAMDDDALIFSPWALHSSGQILRVTGFDGDSLVLDKPLRRNYTLEPRIFKQQTRKQVHISCINFERVTETAPQTSNIFFDMASDCSVNGAESYRCNFGHITIQNSSRITVQNSYFHDAFAYGDGGQGYGVVLQSTTSDCYIYANTFKHLRHSMLLQSGANGNVLAYNYSTDPYWASFPSNYGGDLVLHGNYPYMNLFEGNVVQNISIDNSHGMNGPFNTFFRNRAELYGLSIGNSVSSQQNLIGNQISNNSAAFYGLYSLQGSDHFQWGNSVKGNITPSGTGEYEGNTLYHYSFPSFYEYYSQVPPIKMDNWQSSSPLTETAYRYSNNEKSICSEKEYENPYLAIDEVDSELLNIFPNPSSGVIYIQGNGITRVELLDVSGKKCHTVSSQTSIDLSQFPTGIYFLKVMYPDRMIIKKLVLQTSN